MGLVIAAKVYILFTEKTSMRSSIRIPRNSSLKTLGSISRLKKKPVADELSQHQTKR